MIQAVTFSSPSWRSLNPVKGSHAVTIPKRSQSQNCQVFFRIFLGGEWIPYYLRQICPILLEAIIGILPGAFFFVVICSTARAKSRSGLSFKWVFTLDRKSPTIKPTTAGETFKQEGIYLFIYAMYLYIDIWLLKYKLFEYILCVWGRSVNSYHKL